MLNSALYIKTHSCCIRSFCSCSIWEVDARLFSISINSWPSNSSTFSWGAQTQCNCEHHGFLSISIIPSMHRHVPIFTWSWPDEVHNDITLIWHRTSATQAFSLSLLCSCSVVRHALSCRSISVDNISTLLCGITKVNWIVYLKTGQVFRKNMFSFCNFVIDCIFFSHYKVVIPHLRSKAQLLFPELGLQYICSAPWERRWLLIYSPESTDRSITQISNASCIAEIDSYICSSRKCTHVQQKYIYCYQFILSYFDLLIFF